MKKNRNRFISVISGVLTVFLVSLLISSCTQSEPTLNAPVPTASFIYNVLTPTGYASPQNLELINTSTNAMGAYWFIPGIGNFTGDTVKATAMFAGTYEVKMLAGGPGGLSDTVRQTVTIPDDNPYAVDPNGIMAILTGASIGNTQRTWVASRVINSVIVWDTYDHCLGQIDGGSGAWWAYGQAEITPGTGRDGYFDDSYTFALGQNSQFIYNDNNTVYLDNGGSPWTKALPPPWNTTLNTVSSSDVYNAAPALKPWGSGNFTYTIAPAPAGDKQLGTITVNGAGAHFGVQDKANGMEQVTPTATSVKYDILRISTGLKDSSTGATYDQIIVGLHYDAGGDVWTFMFRSNY